MTENKIINGETSRLTNEQKDEDDENNVLPPPPDGGYGWVIVMASFVCNMVTDGICYTFGIFLMEIVNYYGDTKGKTAWVGSIVTGMCMCAGPLVSVLTNKFGCRTVCIIGSLIGSTAFVLSTFSTSVIWLMLSYGLMGGIGFGLIYLPAIVSVGYYFETKRSLATGIAVCGSGVGTFAFAPLANFLLKTYGWKGANLVLAGLILNCAICGTLMRPLKYPTKKRKLVSNLSKEEAMVTYEKPRTKESINSLHGQVTNSAGDMIRKNYSTGSFFHRNNTEGNSSVLQVFSSKQSISNRHGHYVQPLARKDIFYSGSILNLKEFQSQKSLQNYRQSIVNLSQVKVIKQNNYVILLKDPLFILIGVSNLFGMAALYIPFVYIADCAIINGIEAGKASFLLSIIGITNTFGRIACGYFADFPQVNALFVNNVSLTVAAISVSFTPFCQTYLAYVLTYIVFAIATAGYISLTSIILVDLLGIEKLTDAFGILILFRGIASLIGSPLAGTLYDATHTYDVPFYVAGALFALAAATSFMVPCVKKAQTRNNYADEATLTHLNQDLENN